MDIRNIFRAISDQLQAEFRKTSEVAHSGGKGGLREDALGEFLINYLPKRYAVGRGEVITPENRTSAQLDVIIYDDSRCPVLVPSAAHAVYPIESVFGAISVKSRLNSGELKEAYANIRSFKQILPRQNFQHFPSGSGFVMGMAFPMPVTGILAYASDRTIEAIAAQAKELDSELPDITLRPDFIAIIDLGIVGPRSPLRGEFNSYTLPDRSDELVQIRKTGRHTLLQVYMQTVRELNALTLRPLDLHHYYDMPRIVGPYRVYRFSRFGAKKLDGSGGDIAMRLSLSAVSEIVLKSVAVTRRQNFLNMFGSVPLDGEKTRNLDEIVYEYNPRGLPPVHQAELENCFMATPLQIDDRLYSVHFASLPAGSFEEDPDFTFDELMSS